MIKMRTQTLTRSEKLGRLIEQQCKWHIHYAIWPVNIKDDMGITHNVFFERVSRKGKLMSGIEGRYIGNWEYCFKEDIVAMALANNTMKDEDGREIDLKDIVR